MKYLITLTILLSFFNRDVFAQRPFLKKKQKTASYCTNILDAWCGTGRNLVYFLNSGYHVFGVDKNEESISQLKKTTARYPLINPEENFHVTAVENLPFENEKFDLVISSAVLHFAENLTHFELMLDSMWRVLKKGGYFFCRLASEIGIESSVHFIGNGRYILPDGSERFLVNQEMLLRLTKRLGGELHEPIKATNVQNLRAMTTWCVRK
ncbi:class I SAM-dependent methyltransferase [Pedobacter soli]|uniref:Methyltransferase domain-containing protein n=1 Tax=Pedobacter soli TaxID=390242 RepID=A0A1G6XQP4_9SPHI|nr:class I SAM-dependent methyltransferase [Pedobacter soli]SDD80539.1 Methyltransferase domain-containing protein [Pedobacter soli]